MKQREAWGRAEGKKEGAEGLSQPKGRAKGQGPRDRAGPGRRDWVHAGPLGWASHFRWVTPDHSLGFEPLRPPMCPTGQLKSTGAHSVSRCDFGL